MTKGPPRQGPLLASIPFLTYLPTAAEKPHTKDLRLHALTKCTRLVRALSHVRHWSLDRGGHGRWWDWGWAVHAKAKAEGVTFDQHLGGVRWLSGLGGGRWCRSHHWQLVTFHPRMVKLTSIYEKASPSHTMSMQWGK